MAIDEAQRIEPPDSKRTTFGSGLRKGLQITMRHLLQRTVTIQYPDEKDPLPARSRGVIALKTENCTVCMLCARECPDWCIYIEGHKEAREPAAPGRRAKKFNVLDRFAIDYALCMYCGICVEVCPYDALFWSPEYEYAEEDIVELTHEIERLNDWMYYVMPPPALEDGAKGPELKIAAPVATTAAATPAPARTQADVVTATRPDQSDAVEGAATADASAAPPADATAEAPEQAEGESGPAVASSAEPAAEAPAAGGHAVAGMSPEEAAEVRKQVYEEQIGKGSDPRVADARAKAAESRALHGLPVDPQEAWPIKLKRDRGEG